MFDFNDVDLTKVKDEPDGGMTLTAKLRKAEKTELSEALRKQIIQLLTVGSETDDGALTPQVLARVERVARTGMDLLVAVSASNNNLAALIRRKRRPPFGGVYPGGLDMDGDGEDGLGAVFAPAPPAENFGMVALREMMAALKNVNQDPVKLVNALAVARREKMDDVVKDLEAKLGIGKPGNDAVTAFAEGATAAAEAEGNAEAEENAVDGLTRGQRSFSEGVRKVVEEGQALQRLVTPERTVKKPYDANDRAPVEDE